MAYSVDGYGKMIQDAVRMDAYAEALRRVVQPGDVVLDIGTGPGIHALLACRLGARKVFAIEPADIIQVARSVASANGFADRIEFYQDFSTRVELPEQADVIVCDMRDILPLFRKHIPSIADARRRLLKPGGRLIPVRDEIRAAIVDAPELHDSTTAPWSADVRGFDLRAGHRTATNQCFKVRVNSEQLLTAPGLWATIDYRAVEDPNVRGDLRWKVQKPGTGHGILAWFDAVLTDGVGFSNAPGAPEAIYGQAFFPWPEAVPLETGDVVEVNLRADLVGEDYVWSWNTRVLRGDSPSEVKAAFRQSTFFGEPLSLAQLKKRDSTHVPARNEEAEIDHFVLARMDGSVPLGDIAGQLVAAFPKRFSSMREALTRAGELSVRYSK